MTENRENVDIVVLSSTSIVRALVSAGLSIQDAQAAARLFMPHLRVQERAEHRACKTARVPRSSGTQLARKRASAMLSMLDKEVARLCLDAANKDQAQRARRESGLALLHILKAEHQAQKRGSRRSPRLTLSSAMRVLDPDL